MRKGIISVVILIAVSIFAGFAPMQAAATNVGGAIASNTTWYVTSSPYVVTSPVTVDPGVTLTIEPGVIVKFSALTYLDVNGTLNAAGTAVDRISFTDYRDDSIGGDTNGDGASTGTAGSWWGINILDGGTATLNYCTVRYAYGQYMGWYNDHGGPFRNLGGVYKTGTGSLNLQNSTVSDSLVNGVWIVNSTGTHALSNNTIGGNGGYGVRLENTGSTVTLSGNAIGSNTSGPMYVTSNSSGVTVATDNTISGTIRIEGGSIPSDTTWSSNQVYQPVGVITVPAQVTLTIQPGAVVKFSALTYLDINGTLNAVGTGNSRISFTDYRDDTIGGDSNGDGSASAPAAGSWWGINILDGGTATLNYCTVRYAYGQYIGWWGNSFFNRNFGGVYKTGTGSLNLQNSTVSDSLVNGVWIVNSTGTHALSNNAISGNGGYGVRLENTGSTVTLSGNTIGSNTSGPMYVTSNSSGVAVATDNTISGTIRIEGGSIPSDTTWSSNQVYQPVGVITVPAQVTLTIQPGAVVKFSALTYLDVNGTLNAVGTGNSRISFTDYRDDTIGGDSNGDGSASAPAAGSWWGINVLDGGTATLNYCTVRYTFGGSIGWWGNSYYGRNFGGVYKTGAGFLTLQNSIVNDGAGNGAWIVDSTGTHTIANSTLQNNVTGIKLTGSAAGNVNIRGNTIRNNTGNGIYLGNSNPAITRNSISGNPTGIACTGGANPLIGGAPALGNDLVANTGLAISNDTPSVTVNARYNWWGTPAGPILNGVNGVSPYVDYGSFLSDSFSQGLGAGLVSLWKGDGNALDLVGENSGTLLGGAGFAVGIDGQAFNFNGSGQYLQKITPVAIPVGSSPRTVSAWIGCDGPTAGTKYQTVVGYGTPGSNGQTFLLEWGGEVNDRHLYLTGWNLDLAGATLLEYGQWYHVAATYDGTAVSLYVNGSLEASANRALNTALNPDGLLIGASPSNDGWHGYFNGRIDEVAVYNRALSAEEVGSLAGTVPNAFSFISQTGMPRNTIIVSNPVTVTGTSYPTSISVSSGGEYRINSNGWTNTDGTVNPGDTVKVQVISSNEYSATTTATLTIGGVGGTFSVTTAAATDPNASGLVSWWRAENNTYDSVGGNHATPQGGITYAAGLVGQAFSLDGVNGYAQVASPVGLPVDNAPRSVGLWFKTPRNLSASTEAALFQYGSASTANMFGLIASGNAPGKLYFYGHSADLAGTTTIVPDTWYHGAVTYDGTTVRLYLNGQQEASAPMSLNTVLDGNGLTVGYRVGGAKWQGEIDEVKVYNRALSATEVGRFYGIVPDPFTFTPVTSAPRTSSVESNAITVTGISHPTTISATDGQYQINGSGTWTASTGTFNPGDTVKVRLNSSASYSTTTSATLTIGGVEGTFSVTTLADTEKPVVTTFTLHTAVSSAMSISVDSFIATDNDRVSGYLVTDTATPPAADDPGWIATAPATVSLSKAGDNILRAWAKDPAGNVSEPFTATVLLKPVRREPENDYVSLQTAYGEAGSGETIRVLAVTLAENIDLNQPRNVSISGGYEDGFAGQNGFSTIQGTVTIGKGTVTIEQVIIR